MDKYIVKSILKMLKMFHVKIDDKITANVTQFIKFIIVGFSNTVVGYGVNIVVILLLQPYDVFWDYYAGNIVSFILAVLWSFYWNNRYVFNLKNGEKRNLASSLLKAYLSYAFTGLILSNILSYLWVEVLDISKMISPLINMVIGIPINFILNKLWTFKVTKEK